MMRSVSTKPDIKILKAAKKVTAPKKNHISTPIRDTISETISFVIKGKLTPLLFEKRSPLTVKKTGTKTSKILKKSDDKLKKLKEKNVKVNSKVQGKSSKKVSAQTSCKRKFDKIQAKEVPENLSKLVKKKRNLDDKPKKNIKTAVKTKPIKKTSKNQHSKTNQISESTKLIDEDEIKKQQTIEQLLKQVNEEIKSKKCRISKKTNKIKKRKKIVECAEEKISVDPLRDPLLDKVIKSEIIEATADSEIKIKDEKPVEEITLNKEVILENKEIKSELTVDEKEPTLKKKKYVKLKSKPKVTVIKKRVTSKNRNKVDEQACKTKLFKFWNGPKRHRVASLNALAKVHCLYENETRATILDVIDESNKTAYNPKRDTTKNKSNKIDELVVKDEDFSDDSSPPPTRILRSVPGLRAVGKHWDMHDTTSSDEDDHIVKFSPNPEKLTQPKVKVKKEILEKKRRSNEIVMDLKDMVVRKRMASLNASAILAASYSPEKRHNRSKYSTDDSSSCASNSSEEYFAALDKDIKLEEEDKKEDEAELIEVRKTPNKKVAVILNQDTDVTITGVYVNSTTRSTHHEGYCSIAGMQYRISATSHTQTAATAVSTEALLQTSSNSGPDNSNSDSMPSSKSYTPLDALSNMQPPPGPGVQHNHPVLHGQQHMGPPQHVIGMPPHQLSPGLRHSCSSAFSSPHSTPSYQTPPGHHPPIQGDAGYVHAGYYQPAGPLITVPPPQGHSQSSHPPPPPLSKTIPQPSETSPSSSTTPSVIPHDVPPPPPSSTGDSSDSEVIITSVTTAKDTVPPPSHPPTAYRYQYPGYSYPYPPHSYPYPTPPPNPPYSNHDMCYSPNPYVHKYPIRRYLTTQYYPPPNPTEIYPVPPSGPSQPSQQVVTATPASGNATTYPAAPPTIMETYASPQAALVESYQPPPPSHYYPPPAAFGPPAPTCYSHPSSRAIPYINAYQSSCPCPMQSCPKNVHTGPLTGECKRSNISNDSMPLPPVALALPLEPASATGPPSPARGSAGMPPPPSPAGATYQAPPPVPAKLESDLVINQDQCKTEKKRKARIGKAMVRNNIAANLQPNTMLLMCGNSQDFVKREIESPQEQELEQKSEPASDEEKKFSEDPCTKTEELQHEESQLSISIQPKEEKVTVEPHIESPKPLPPVISTVAENVKVKNMKRKLSMLSDKEPSPEAMPLKKKQKCGSYKLLIKKETNSIKINNGKQKLLGEMSRLSKTRQTKLKLRKRPAKTSMNFNNEETVKRRKLTISGNTNCKSHIHHSTETKDKKLLSSFKKVNSKSISAIQDKTPVKNNIERTIESVISDTRLRTQDENNTSKTEKCGKQQTNNNKTVINKKSTNNKVVVSKKLKVNPKKTENNRRKSKCSEVTVTPIRRPLSVPKWSNGWRWEGESFEAKVFLNSDELTIMRNCYPAMRHEGGDKIVPKDCVLLKAGPRKNDLPFVAKIAALWENPEDGEMMMSLLWYYRPEHTEQGRLPADQPDEVFASRHKDSNSVACIDDKCYVLTFNEYCRYRKTYKRIESGIEEALPCIPNPEPYPRSHRQPPMTLVSPEMVFFCRRVYDFRQKRIMKNPT